MLDIVFLLLLLIGVAIVTYVYSDSIIEGFFDEAKQGTSKFVCANVGACNSQMKLVSNLADARNSSRSNVEQAIQEAGMEDQETCLVNFYTLGCRFAGYLGPFAQGYFAPEAATSALRMGCRTFVFEIDYFNELCGMYPRLVVRNSANISQSVLDKNTDCNSITNSNILDTCTALAQTAFSGTQTDPLIIVLYVLRDPPDDGKRDYDTVRRTYYTQIAQGLAPLLPYAVTTTMDGNFYRQMNESALLKTDIRNFKKKVLFFSNASTEIFRKAPSPIPTDQDLDYIVNLRLTYTQTQLGVTLSTNPNSNGSKFGVLDSTEAYTTIPPDQIVSTSKTISNGTWTICLSPSPSTIVPQDTTDLLQKKLGIHCIPIQIWSPEYDYMFTKDYYKIYSYRPKPPPLRVPMDKIVIAGKANKAADANGGSLIPSKIAGAS